MLVRKEIEQLLTGCLSIIAIGIFLSLFFFLPASLIAQPSSSYRPIELNPEYDHNPFGITPVDIVYEFAAFTTSFDSEDDDNGDGLSDIRGIPEFVAYEVKKDNGETRKKYKRPRWMTDDTLHTKGIAPDDDTYRVSRANELKEVRSEYRFVRGHMCPKSTADRISTYAGYNTHTVLNAVPQLQWQNQGVWKELEEYTLKKADKYGQVWVICGPVFFGKNPALWLGQDDEVKAAVPDALFKILIRKDDSEAGISTLAFIIPNIVPSDRSDPADFLTSVARIEEVTGMEFFTRLDKSARKKVLASQFDPEAIEKNTIYLNW